MTTKTLLSASGSLWLAAHYMAQDEWVAAEYWQERAKQILFSSEDNQYSNRQISTKAD